MHRDIKPGNVMLRKRTGSLQAYLGDFGIARQAADRSITQAGGTVGTPSYMAPELHVGGDAGVSTDVYSLGCLLWAALSGRAPYAAGSDFEIMRGHLEAQVPQLAPTGPLATEINRVLRTALAKTAADRYPSAAAMRDDLNRVARLPDDPHPIRIAGVPSPAGPAAAGAWQPPGVPTPTPAPRPPTPTPTPSGGYPTAGFPAPSAARARSSSSSTAWIVGGSVAGRGDRRGGAGRAAHRWRRHSRHGWGDRHAELELDRGLTERVDVVDPAGRRP